MNFDNWNYDSSSWLPDDTKNNIYNLFKSSSSENIYQFLNFLNENHNYFLISYKDFIISKLIEFKQYKIVDYLINEKIINFDVKIANLCITNITLNFELDDFNYFCEKINIFNNHDKHSVYKSFWNEFLSYQFMRNEDFHTSIHNLNIVFEKIPFYILSEYDIVNGYLIKFREDFFNTKISNYLTKENNVFLLNQIAILCGQKYPDFESTFKEEFTKFPELILLFEKSVFNTKLTKNLPLKNIITTTKI